MLNKIYIALAAAALCYYTADAWLGWEYGNPKPAQVPAEARRSPGWSHTSSSHGGVSHIWYSGYRGGK